MSLYDPLQINLEKQIGSLLSNDDALLHISEEQLSILQLATEGGSILAVLSELLHSPALTSPIARLFRPLLVDLCARWTELQGNEEQKFIALAALLGYHPEIFPYCFPPLRRTPN
jgi:midasin